MDNYNLMKIMFFLFSAILIFSTLLGFNWSWSG